MYPAVHLLSADSSAAVATLRRARPIARGLSTVALLDADVAAGLTRAAVARLLTIVPAARELLAAHLAAAVAVDAAAAAHVPLVRAAVTALETCPGALGAGAGVARERAIVFAFWVGVGSIANLAARAGDEHRVVLWARHLATEANVLVDGVDHVLALAKRAGEFVPSPAAVAHPHFIPPPFFGELLDLRLRPESDARKVKHTVAVPAAPAGVERGDEV